MMLPPVSTPDQPLGENGCQWAGWMKRDAGDDKDQDGGDFEQHHDVVGLRGFADTPHQHDGQKQHDEKGGKLKPRCQPGW